VCRVKVISDKYSFLAVTEVGTLLISGHDQPPANTCVAAVVAVRDCRRAKVTKDGRRLDRFYAN